MKIYASANALERLRLMIPVWAVISIILLPLIVLGLVSTGPEGSQLTMILSLAAPFVVACIGLAIPDQRIAVGMATGAAQLMSVLGIPLAAISLYMLIFTLSSERGVWIFFYLFLAVQILYYREADSARKASGRTASEYFGWGYLVGTLGPIIALLVLGSLFGG